MWMMKGCSGGGCRDPNIHNSRDLPDYSIIKPANLQPLLTQERNSTSNMTQNPVVPFNHNLQQMIPVTSSDQVRSCYSKNRPPKSSAVPLRSSRWNPTPHQLMALEKLYRCGLKTPKAQQIRQLTAQLRIFGRIEGKNVFYWFQNHRARERQKIRREQQQQNLSNNTISSLQDKGSAGDEQQNKWTLPNNFTIPSDQESSSILQERMMSMVKSNSCRQLLEHSDSPRSASDTNATATLVCSKHSDFHRYYDYDYGMVLTATDVYKGGEEEESRENQTLELFPLVSENLKDAKDTKLPISITASTIDTTADFMPDRSIFSISLNILRSM